MQSNIIQGEEDEIYNNLHNCKKISKQGSAIRQVISQFRIGMDLTAVACPAFILRPMSLLEMNAENMAPLDCLCAASTQPQPTQRMLAVTKWLLSGCSLIPQKGLDHSKPYNPILGERFSCEFTNGELFVKSRTRYYAEQVSHHPPVSAAMMINEDSNFKVLCISQPNITFHGNWIEMKLMGSNVLTFTNLNEEYDITLPPVNVCGLVLGKSKVEYGKQLIVRCKQTGVEVIIDMKPKNEIKGEMTMNGSEIYKFHGNMNGKMKYEDVESSEEHVLLDYHRMFRPKKLVNKVSESEDMESRKVWHNVTKSIVEGDLETCTQRKSTIEEEQRAVRKQSNYEPVWFKHIAQRSSDGVQLYKYCGNTTAL
jgi:hypothetical protein